MSWQYSKETYKLMHEGIVEDMRIAKELEPYLKQCKPIKAKPHKHAIRDMFEQMNEYLPKHQRVKYKLRNVRESAKLL